MTLPAIIIANELDYPPIANTAYPIVKTTVNSNIPILLII